MGQHQKQTGFQAVTLALLGISVTTAIAFHFMAPLDKTSARPEKIHTIRASQTIIKAPLPQKATLKPVLQDTALSAKDLDHTYATLAYTITGITTQNKAVPALFINKLPHDLKDGVSSQARKSIFLRTLLPLVLKINRELKKDRALVLSLRHRDALSLPIASADLIWLNAQFKRYKVTYGDFKSLLTRLDQIPPSLALAQAAEESGWGTSRFARQGNALFGQWTFNPKDKGIVPAGRAPGKTHRIKAYDSVEDSLRDYAKNLNTHKAYAPLRKVRASMRKNREALDGRRLAATLDKYSERGTAYITSLHGLMDSNNLSAFDAVKLDPTPLTPPDHLHPFI